MGNALPPFQRSAKEDDEEDELPPRYIHYPAEYNPTVGQDGEQKRATATDGAANGGSGGDRNAKLSPNDEDDDEGFNSDNFISNYISTAKYTPLNFLPLNLMEQFKKVANVYFLIIAVLSTTPVSPKSPLFSVLPLLFVLTVSAVKEAVEDRARHRMDKELNNTPIWVYRSRWYLPQTFWQRVCGSAEPEFEGAGWRKLPWKLVKVGDIVRITQDEPSIPADCLLLQSSQTQGMCNIETSNLDGETNLKVRQAVSRCWQIDTNEDGTSYPESFKGKLTCVPPNAKMDSSSWQGLLTLPPYQSEEFGNLPQEDVAVGMTQLLLRGCTLRNTHWVVCMVVFTGRETKLMLNANKVVFKRSNVDRIVDKALISIFLIQAILCVLGATFNTTWQHMNGINNWYLRFDQDSIGTTTPGQTFITWILAYFTFLVIMDYFVPISLYVSMELVKYTQAFFINQDLHMWDDEAKVAAKARTSNLNEELGQIDYIFSDKTGTLTRNKMEFMHCCVNGIAYGPGEAREDSADPMLKPREPVETPANMPPVDSTFRFDDNRLLHHLIDDEQKGGDASGLSERRQNIDEFLTLLAICNSIIPEYPNRKDVEPDPFDVEYQAASPDEKALAIAAKNLQYFFQNRESASIDFRGTIIDGQAIDVTFRGVAHRFELLEYLEFNSTRKRMSVIVRDPRDGLIKLYCKGADNVIFTRLTDESRNTYWADSEKHLARFANEGLRTLCCAYRVLSEDEFDEWFTKHREAKKSLENRDALVDESAEDIEQELRLCGATAIEDRLQDGVPEAIATLAQAKMCIWVLTGDKVETAINIGRSCKLLTPQMNPQTNTMIVIDVDEHKSDAEVEEDTIAELEEAMAQVADLDDGQEDQALVISGRALSVVFPHRKLDHKGREKPPSEAEAKKEAVLQKKLFEVCKKCRAVVCCRVSPKQKAQVVDMVKQQQEGCITLSIGDGANDVPMIKSAHVGIGISGQEGLQATMASDYAISQFRFLMPLLMVHGTWSYQRISKLINYSFYKNCCISLTQIWFAIYSAWSGQLFYDPFAGSLYNLIFTALPVLLCAVFDREMAYDSATRFPKLYVPGQRNELFNLKLFGWYMLEGAYHSVVVFFFATGVMLQDTTHPQGEDNDLWVGAETMFSYMVIVVNVKIMFETFSWIRWTVVSFVITYLAWFLFTIVFGTFIASAAEPDVLGVSLRVLATDAYWLGLLSTILVAMLPEIVYRYAKMEWFSAPLDDVKMLENDPKRFERLAQEAKMLLRPGGGDSSDHHLEIDNLPPYDVLVDKPSKKKKKKSVLSPFLKFPRRKRRTPSVSESTSKLVPQPSNLGFAPFAPNEDDARTGMSQREFMERRLTQSKRRLTSQHSMPSFGAAATMASVETTGGGGGEKAKSFDDTSSTAPVPEMSATIAETEDPTRGTEMGARLSQNDDSDDAATPPASSSPNMQGTVNASRADYNV